MVAEGERIGAKELQIPLVKMKMRQQGLGNYAGASVVDCQVLYVDLLRPVSVWAVGLKGFHERDFQHLLHLGVKWQEHSFGMELKNKENKLQILYCTEFQTLTFCFSLIWKVLVISSTLGVG